MATDVATAGPEIADTLVEKFEAVDLKSKVEPPIIHPDPVKTANIIKEGSKYQRRSRANHP